MTPHQPAARWHRGMILTAALAMTGAVLMAGHWLSQRGYSSSRSLYADGVIRFAIEQDPLILMDGHHAAPPLLHWLGALVALAGADHPSLWIAALSSGGLMSFFILFTLRLQKRSGGTGRACWMACAAAPLQSGWWAAAAAGSPTVLMWLTLLPALALLARYLLEMRVFVAARARGQMSAWLESDGYLQGRLHLLWGAALLLALTSLAQPWQGLLLAGFLPLTWWLLPPGERGNGAKVFTLWLLIFTPLLATQGIMAYLQGIFSGDPWLYLHHSREALLRMAPQEALHSTALTLCTSPGRAVLWLLGGFLLATPLLLYLLLRLRSASVALLFLVPWIVQAIMFTAGQEPPSWHVFGLAQLSTILCFILAARFKCIIGVEKAMCLILLWVGTGLGWLLQDRSPLAADQALARSWRNPAPPPEEQMLAHQLKRNPEWLPLLADQRLALPIIGARGTSRGIITQRSPGYSTTLFQSNPPVVTIATRNPSWPVPGGALTDDVFLMLTIHSSHLKLERITTPETSQFHRIHTWRHHPPPQP